MRLKKRQLKKKFYNERISAKHNESNMDIVMRNFHCQVQGSVMYKEGVVKLQVARYKKTYLIKSFNNQGWICTTCDSALMKGKMQFRLKLKQI